MGPILIFDKSTLQSLNPDEAMWLDNFFLTNITPLFFIETLADLEKEVRRGRTPEQVVGNLAYKTPDMGSRPNIHHTTLIAAELTGADTIDMRYGRPIISGGKPVMLEGRMGVIFQQSPEEEALRRWQKGEFLEIERTLAKAWRKALSNINHQENYKIFRKWFIKREKPKTLADVKSCTDAFIDGPDPERAFRIGLSLLRIPQYSQERVIARWHAAGRPSISDFAPYFRYVFSVDLFFYLAMAADLISRIRPSNKIDLAYLYYLPFCMVFASSDSLHSRVVPLFLRSFQTFVEGAALKADLGKLDEYYSLLPEEVKDRGIFSFAEFPPTNGSFLVTQLWDKYLPKWREQVAEPQRPINKDTRDAISKLIQRFEKEAVPIDPATRIVSDDTKSLIIQRKVYARKGKWKRFPPEVEQAPARAIDDEKL